MTVLRLRALLFTCAAAAAAAAGALPAQSVNRASLAIVGANLTEVDSSRSASGPGAAALIWLRRDRWHFEATASYASLSPGQGTSYGATQWDLRLGYALTPSLALEAGLGARAISPDTRATAVRAWRIGVRPEMHFARQSAVWGRGAFLIAPRFNGAGGDYGLAVELGLGAAIGLGGPDGRFRLRADYDFQRIDRRNGGTALPIQLGVMRLGVDAAW